VLFVLNVKIMVGRGGFIIVRFLDLLTDLFKK